MKIIAIKEMSCGNKSVGEMWKETKIFDETDILADVIEWINKDKRKNVILSIADNVDTFKNTKLPTDDMPF